MPECKVLAAYLMLDVINAMLSVVLLCTAAAAYTTNYKKDLNSPKTKVDDHEGRTDLDDTFE
jgi:hypothetical protein